MSYATFFKIKFENKTKSGRYSGGSERLFALINLPEKLLIFLSVFLPSNKTKFPIVSI